MSTKVTVYKRQYDSSGVLVSQRVLTRTINNQPYENVVGQELVTGNITIDGEVFGVIARRSAGSNEEFATFVDIYP